MATEIPINVYGLNLTPKEQEEWAKRPKTTYYEIEIPEELEDEIDKAVKKIIKKHKVK